MYANEKYPSKILQEAVEAIGSLPGVGSRSALRLALHLLGQPAENIHQFTAAINRLADDVHYCSQCQMIADSDTCAICADRTRDARTICVVESVRDVMSIEATGQYRGVYHVLGGIISPIDGIGPSDIRIKELVDRIRTTEQMISKIEIILALSGDVEGETTSLYIYRQIEGLGVKVSTLARGLGFGDDLEYADSLTLGRSLLARQPFKP
ncbi:MAG: recombination protein RecR [Bacteroidales bacterium]|nr:recombination protein RecR [Bacteroidales bacterium]MBR1578815.1 recombination protein RecR [Bacteroidales bacterium]